jgi:hypothetical protein
VAAEPLPAAESSGTAPADQPAMQEPVLTAEELRALLDDDTVLPPTARRQG